MRNYIALAIPFFFLLIGLELLIARLLGRRGVYHADTTVSDLGCGVGQQATVVFTKGLRLALYVLLYEGWRALELDADSPWTWLIAFLGVEILYYWWHRLSHEVNFLWAAHIVHHQSEDMNLAVALRQALFTSITIIPFYMPLAVLGVPPLVFAAVNSFTTLYQFWIHTDLVPRLGPLEWLLNTPSAHRVHHAINPRYLDRNYGATLIVWDRLFGSYAAEVEAPVYGIVKPLRSRNPIWANVHYWVDLVRLAATAPRWRDKAWVWLARPDWRPAGLPALPPPPDVTPESYRKYDAGPPAGRLAYAGVQFVATLAATLVLLVAFKGWPFLASAAGAGFVLLSLGSVGGLLEARAWAVPLEVARVVGGASAAAVLVADPAIALAIAGGAVIILVWLRAACGAGSPGGPPREPTTAAIETTLVAGRAAPATSGRVG